MHKWLNIHFNTDNVWQIVLLAALGSWLQFSIPIHTLVQLFIAKVFSRAFFIVELS